MAKVKFRPFDSIDNRPEEKARGITIAIAHVKYETKNRLRTGSAVQLRSSAPEL